MTEQGLREVSCGGIVLRKSGDKTEILLIKDLSGFWTWPKGKCEPDETFRETALREVEEETGLGNLRILKKVGRVGYVYRRSGRSIRKNVHYYLMDSGADGRLSAQIDEIMEARWFSAAEALRRVSYHGSKTFLRKALAAYEKRVIR